MRGTIKPLYRKPSWCGD